MRSLATAIKHARLVEAALARQHAARGLSLAELSALTDLPPWHLRRLLAALVEAGVPVESAPDPRSTAHPASRPLIYWLASRPAPHGFG